MRVHDGVNGIVSRRHFGGLVKRILIEKKKRRGMAELSQWCL